MWKEKASTEVTAFLFSDLLILTNRFDSELNLRVLFKTELCFAFPRKKLTRSHV